MVVRPLEPDEIDTYRRIRLEALRHDPDAFGSTYEFEAGYDDDTWRARMTTFSGAPGQVFVAQSGESTLGMVGIGSGAGSETAILWGMWVRPGARGTGLARQLLEAAMRWAAESGAKQVVLQVARGNTGAYRLYERNGFEHIGESPMRPDDPCSLAHLMARSCEGTS